MNLDLRVPMGLLFTIIGALLAVFGVFSRGSAIYQSSGGLNINFIWGLVMLVFGTIMLWLGRRAGKRPPAKPIEGTQRPLGHNSH